ncbi:MAG: hypothetical protein BWY92_01493 [Firmicutes bacterium ADurb.BinA052]|nr:MAG: hypothetical protein BWY92_01493 [Firmicutes bacterium ADurb.BinA052]
MLHLPLMEPTDILRGLQERACDGVIHRGVGAADLAGRHLYFARNRLGSVEPFGVVENGPVAAVSDVFNNGTDLMFDLIEAFQSAPDSPSQQVGCGDTVNRKWRVHANTS